MNRRVVVTGMGAISPMGIGVAALWQGLIEGRSCAAPITRFDASAYTTTFACEVPGFDPVDHMEKKFANRLDLFAQYAVAAAREALTDAGLEPGRMDAATAEGAGVIFGSGQGGLSTFEEQVRILVERGPARISPFLVPKMIPDMAAGAISIEFGLRGPNHCVVSACATGNDNIASALSLIRSGACDVVVTGGSEAPICGIGLGGFAASRALSVRNDDPAAASRPFDMERDGFVIGEGAGALVLESLDHAERRGARIVAEVRGFGASADAYHLTAPHPEGLGARLALERALDDARVSLDEVDLINMHATSTPLGDAAESEAIRAIFTDEDKMPSVTSTKSMTGHLLGAAGAIESIATALSIVHGIVPPTINLVTQDPACRVRVVANVARQMEVRTALSNAFGFGGHNTTIVLSRCVV